MITKAKDKVRRNCLSWHN